MKVIIHNNRYEDSITFEVEEINEETRNNILRETHSRGWEDADCWSEVKK